MKSPLQHDQQHHPGDEAADHERVDARARCASHGRPVAGVRRPRLPVGDGCGGTVLIVVVDGHLPSETRLAKSR